MLRPLTKVFLAPYPSIGKTCVKLKFLEFAKKINTNITIMRGTIIRLHFITALGPNLLIKPAASNRNSTIKEMGVLWKYIVFKFSEVLLTNSEAAKM